ncbi:PhzF family phenazine biosynthesis protein [Pseudomonas graminis]|uniref:Phenazine biosynthesis protein PhzF n=1 Tax=Pseudomonas graminis TaxID=158627 RepID=A0A1C2DRM2_9PSED|nr:PhzF family phenazine biosynthesis protein [Pseudomonas graminis]OCX17431.1 phenazine biosynthesis protein PhzF [Pseudomonas graminis]
MTEICFKQVDVFTAERFMGNPVAVVLEAEGLSDDQMQQIANWTNLSETTFVLPKKEAVADYRVRIFTPGSELPFAGHPTIGTAHALLEAGVIHASAGVVIQECGVGLVRLHVSVDKLANQVIAFELPEATITTLQDAEVRQLEAILGMPVHGPRPALVDVGARWIVAQLPDARQVLENQPDLEQMKIHNLKARATGVVIFGKHQDGSDAGVEVRAYAPACGVNEDPVCGSGNGAMAAFIRDTGQASDFGTSLLASQGVKVNRRGFIQLSITGDVITVGGNAVTCISGTMSI